MPRPTLPFMAFFSLVAGGMSRQGLEELLRLPCCDPAVRRYVDERVKPRLQVGAA